MPRRSFAFIFLILTACLIQIVESAYEALDTLYCPSGYYFNTLMLRCDQCQDGCICTSSTTCTSCLSGRIYVYDGSAYYCYPLNSSDYILSDCESYYISPTNNNIICTQCRNGSLFEGICRSLPALVGCLVEKNDFTCLTLKAGYYLDSSTITACDDYNADQCIYTTACSSTNHNLCPSCNSGYYVYTTDSTCETDCSRTGCSICPNGCLVCNSSTLACTSCSIGYFLDDSSNCVSCEREYGNKCNQCTKTACTECKNLYYLASKTGTPRCFACPNPKVCQSATAFTSCTSGSYVQKLGVYQCTAQDYSYVTEINYSGVIQTCASGYEIDSVICRPSSTSVISTCEDGCTTCDPLTNVCSACTPISYMLNSQSNCIACSLSGDETDANQVFFIDDLTCYSIFTYPVNLDNCLTYAGVAYGGVCKVCDYGYILDTTTNMCVSCVNIVVATSSTANSIDITVSYSCTGPTYTAATTTVTFDLNTVAVDPYTQPTFYSIRYGLPLSIANKLNLTSLAPPVLANDQQETSTTTQQTQEVNSNVINDAQTQKTNDSNVLGASLSLILLVCLNFM